MSKSFEKDYAREMCHRHLVLREYLCPPKSGTCMCHFWEHRLKQMDYPSGLSLPTLWWPHVYYKWVSEWWISLKQWFIPWRTFRLRFNDYILRHANFIFCNHFLFPINNYTWNIWDVSCNKKTFYDWFIPPFLIFFHKICTFMN